MFILQLTFLNWLLIKFFTSKNILFSSAQSCHQSRSLLKFMSSKWWCHPTVSFSIVPFSSCLQSFPTSGFSNESVLHLRWPKYGRFSFNISLANEYSGLISFRIHWLDLLAIQGTLKSLLQHHSWKVSILQNSAFFIVQFSHPYMIT